MAIRSKNAHYDFHTIQARHWHQLATKNGGAAVWEAMLGLVERVDKALATVESGRRQEILSTQKSQAERYRRDQGGRAQTDTSLFSYVEDRGNIFSGALLHITIGNDQ